MYKAKLRKLHKKQKHEPHIICNEDKYSHANPLMESLPAFNIYEINIYQVLILTFKSQNLSPIFKFP